jgi:DNA repair protein RecO (recombination protein O)
MIQKANAIVLHQVKYAETSLVVTLYTDQLGRQSFLINGIRSVKSKQKTAIIQPLFLWEIEAYQKPGRDVNRLKEFKLASVYQTIPFDVVKGAVVMFLSEVLYKVLRSEEKDASLFEFIAHSLNYFDSLKSNYANFHLWFLVNLLANLGFKLYDNNSAANGWFDLKTGSFVPIQPKYPNAPDRDESKMMAQLIGLNAENLHQFTINGKQRARLLAIVIDYYSMHIDSMGNIKSLSVLQDVFQQ